DVSCFFSPSTSCFSLSFSALSCVRSPVSCCTCCIARALLSPVRCVCAPATAAVNSSGSANNRIETEIRITTSMRLKPWRLERTDDVDHQCVDAERRAVDFVRTQIAQRQRRAIAEPPIALDHVTLCVGAAEMKIGVGECIDHGVALQIAIF